MRIIGLTGGIATGKSTVSHFLATHSVPIVDADVIARDIVRPGQVAYFSIIDAFGPGVLDFPDGTINRQRLGGLIFGNADQRRKLNSITHPYIRLEILLAVLSHFLRGDRVCVLDTPLLFEAGLYRWVHSVVVVYSPDTIQKERLIRRDGLTPLQAQLRIDSQMPIERKRTMADFVLDNSGALLQTRRQVEDLLAKLVPSPWLSTVVWGLLLVPAACLYGLLLVFRRVDRWRRVGLLTTRALPSEAVVTAAAAAINAQIAASHAAAAAAAAGGGGDGGDGGVGAADGANGKQPKLVVANPDIQGGAAPAAGPATD
ncbi:dephospho-CoA kinase-domain-containing protein [Entophlyctis helioformis]|nr:dephospho-CoA kinase-domain-containing protein [Entophlyctis helioformis]